MRCEAADQVIAEVHGAAITCRASARVRGYIEAVAGRPLQHNGASRLPSALRDRFRADPAGTLAWVAQVAAAADALHGTTGLDAAERRGRAAWEAHTGEGPIQASHGEVWSIQRDALAVWAWSNEERLALTEADAEGWLYYASLCREAQQAGPLRISVADRVTAYRAVVDRFEGGTREEKIALVAIGPFWSQVREVWRASPYTRQQAWIAAAPLPPPMTATSLGYFDTLMAGPVRGHAVALHDVLGPFVLNSGGGAGDR